MILLGSSEDWALGIAVVSIAVSILFGFFGRRIDARFSRVRISVERKQRGLTYIPTETGTPRPRRIYHLKVSVPNSLAAENVSVFLERVDQLGADGEPRTVFSEGRLMLLWQYEGEQPRRIGPNFNCNFIRASQGEPFTFVTVDTASIRKVKIYEGAVLAWIQAVADNGESSVMKLRIDYKGKWPKNEFDEEAWCDQLQISDPEPCKSMPPVNEPRAAEKPRPTPQP